jgi:hypothetical protein
MQPIVGNEANPIRLSAGAISAALAWKSLLSRSIKNGDAGDTGVAVRTRHEARAT